MWIKLSWLMIPSAVGSLAATPAACSEEVISNLEPKVTNTHS